MDPTSLPELPKPSRTPGKKPKTFYIGPDFFFRKKKQILIFLINSFCAASKSAAHPAVVGGLPYTRSGHGFKLWLAGMMTCAGHGQNPSVTEPGWFISGYIAL